MRFREFVQAKKNMRLYPFRDWVYEIPKAREEFFLWDYMYKDFDLLMGCFEYWANLDGEHFLVPNIPMPKCDHCGEEYTASIEDNSLVLRCTCLSKLGASFKSKEFRLSIANIVDLHNRDIERIFRLFFNDMWDEWKKPEFIDYYQYIDSDSWKQKADDAKYRAGYRCMKCNRKQGQVVLNAHHRTYIRLGHEMPEDIDVLCDECHEKFHEYYSYETYLALFTPKP